MIYKFTFVFLPSSGIGYCAVPDLPPPPPSDIQRGGIKQAIQQLSVNNSLGRIFNIHSLILKFTVLCLVMAGSYCRYRINLVIYILKFVLHNMPNSRWKSK